MYNISEISQMCKHLNQREIKAKKAQYESIKYKQCEYLMDKTGTEFKGIISSIQFFGVFIELIDNGCDVMVSQEWLGLNDLFIDTDNFCIDNFETGEVYRLGDEVTAKIINVNIQRKQISAILIF